MANCLSRRDQKVHLIFQNCAPRVTKVSYSNGFKTKGSVCRDRFITNSNHQFFQDPKSNIWTTFSFFLSWFYDHEIYSFLETSARFIMTKVSKTQVNLWHAHADIKAVFTFLKKHIHEWKHSWSKEKQKLPLVDPLS